MTISKEIWNNWQKENTNERGIAEFELIDGTEISIDFVNSNIRISKRKYLASLEYVSLKENYSASNLDEISALYSKFNARCKELIFGNKIFNLSNDKQTLIEQ